jgi:hypothetical protein
MAILVFTPHLKEVAPVGESQYEGATVRGVLAQAFEDHRLLKNYLLDDRGGMRKHVCIFLDGVRLHNHEALDKVVGEASEIYVMQALSGG